MKVPVSFGTDHSKISIGFRISFDLPEPSILYKGDDSATVTTSIAESWKQGDRCLRHSVGPTLKIEKFMA
jgi:hypothetical protein